MRVINAHNLKSQLVLQGYNKILELIPHISILSLTFKCFHLFKEVLFISIFENYIISCYFLKCQLQTLCRFIKCIELSFLIVILAPFLHPSKLMLGIFIKSIFWHHDKLCRNCVYHDCISFLLFP